MDEPVLITKLFRYYPFISHSGSYTPPVCRCLTADFLPAVFNASHCLQIFSQPHLDDANILLYHHWSEMIYCYKKPDTNKSPRNLYIANK